VEPIESIELRRALPANVRVVRRNVVVRAPTVAGEGPHRPPPVAVPRMISGCFAQ
jgi:hypothetical protein